MKMAFVIHNEHYAKNVLELLKKTGIDYFTRWDNAVGKGHGTDPHMGQGSFPSTNSVLMIAFEDESLQSAAVKFSRYSDTRIVIDDPDVAIAIDGHATGAVAGGGEVKLTCRCR